MEFQTDIRSLKDEDLPRYASFLLDRILCKPDKEGFRTKVLDRVDIVHEEMVRRGLREPTNDGENDDV